VRRREFITLLGGATAAWPVAARAQQPERVRRVGMLTGYTQEDREGRARVGAFEQALQERGWTSGRNLRLDYRWAGGDADRMRVHAADLARLAPDAVLAVTTPAVQAMQQETPAVPIVFVNVSDPVGSGLVASLARPGGNITGFSNFGPLIGGKWVQLLKEIAPHVARVALMSNPEIEPQTRVYSSAIEAAASSSATQLVAAPVHDSTEIETAIAALGRDHGNGLIVLSGIFTFSHRTLIAKLAHRHRVPAVYPYREFAESGGLLSYGIDLVVQFQQAAGYVDRILKGEKAGDLPVQEPTKYELVINLKTARAIGLTVPDTLLARADEVIE
jgi:putative ABC transport system substrate-binding protein